MGEIYKNIVSATEIQLSAYYQVDQVIYPIYLSYNPQTISEDEAIDELQKKYDAFVVPCELSD